MNEKGLTQNTKKLHKDFQKSGDLKKHLKKRFMIL